VRLKLRSDAVMYGLMRMPFGADRFRRNVWVFFLWTPDSMTNEHKKGVQRSQNVQLSGAMQSLMAPWTVSIVSSTLAAVSITDWLLRVKKSVVVDGASEMFTEEAFRKAMESEERWMAEQRAKEKERVDAQRESEQKEREEALRRQRQDMKERAERAKHQSTEFSKLQLKQLSARESAMKREANVLGTPTPDADGNFYVSHETETSPYDDIAIETLPSPSPVNKRPKHDETVTPNTEKLKAMSDAKTDDSEFESSEEEVDEDEEREPSPEVVIELSAEELAELEAERARREVEELAKRTENELMFRGVLESKMVLESVELCKRTAERLCWVLFEGRAGTEAKAKNKFEKKLKLYKKMSNLRERAFLVMCDENKMIDAEMLFGYIEHFGKEKASREAVEQFFEFMKPNAKRLVTFSKFVRAIDEDGDVCAAFERFKTYGRSQSTK